MSTMRIGENIRLPNPPYNSEDVADYLPTLTQDLENILSNGIDIDETYVGPQGPQGDPGPAGSDGVNGVDGTSYQEEFETVSQNLKSWNSTLTYTSGVLTSISYTDGLSTITKTLNYTSGDLTSVVLSGDTPSGLDLTKTLTYTGSEITSINYS